ncbi:hypothetical protein EBR43_02380 [bacterium]|nr:hypothetical protein [bacterium]NBW56634.1 hypothetical protein [bacterium]NBX72456.1 hypothetical protein [bacterium]
MFSLNKRVLLLTVGLYALSTPWDDWKDYYYAQKLWDDIRLFKENVSFYNDPLEVLQDRYAKHPRVLCRLAELYASINAQDRACQLLLSLKNNENLSHKEYVDILLTLEEITTDEKVQLDVLNELMSIEGYNPTLLLKKGLVLLKTKQASSMPMPEKTLLKNAIVASNGVAAWEEIFAADFD